jgi:hypothetical protein
VLYCGKLTAVLLFLVVDDVGSMMYSTRQGLFVIDLLQKYVFDTKYMFGCILASSWSLVWLRLYNVLHTVVD